MRPGRVEWSEVGTPAPLADTESGLYGGLKEEEVAALSGCAVGLERLEKVLG